MTHMLYVYTIIVLGAIKAKNKHLTYLRSRKLTTMTRSVARPSNVGVLWAGILYRGFTVGN